MALHLICQLFKNKENSNKKSYISFIISYKEKIIHQLTLFKTVVVGYIANKNYKKFLIIEQEEPP